MNSNSPRSFFLFLTLFASLVSVFACKTSHSQKAAAHRPTETIGAFITPTNASASSSQPGAGRIANKLIDGSGFYEIEAGTGCYVHTNEIYSDGNCMWNGETNAWLIFDLGKSFSVNGFYVWNYNEGGGWNSRSVKELEILTSEDGKTWRHLDKVTLRQATGQDEEPGETIKFKEPVRTRFFKWQILSNYRGGEMSGLSEVRFANAEVKAKALTAAPWKAKYPRPLYPIRAQGEAVAGVENISFPADSGVIDLSKPPFNLKGDGKTDCTKSIQKALDDNADNGSIFYFPNGVYLISDTLKWGKNERNTILQGQSRTGTVLKLQDSCPGFTRIRKPKGMVNTGHAPAQRFGNEIHNLTFDTGVGNGGACGVQFIANNQGGVYDVTIVSGDGKGAIGLDLGYTDEQGPCLIKNVKVTGFDIGIHVATSVASETLEHITLEHQNRFGFRNDGQPCTIRDLKSLNEVPAFYGGGGSTFLLDAKLVGVGDAKEHSAIEFATNLFAKNIVTSGYKFSASSVGKASAFADPASQISLLLSKNHSALFPSQKLPEMEEKGEGVRVSHAASAVAFSLQLPVKETPELPWDNLKAWVSPLKFGVKPDTETDASEAIQKAIDSGATTVYLPRGSYRISKTIVIRGNVRRIYGCKAFLIPTAPLNTRNEPLFRFGEGSQPIVVIEGVNTDFSGGPFFFMEHDSKRTLVMRRLAVNFQGAEVYRTGKNGIGDIYFEDVVGRVFRIRNQHLWARQFNPEGDGVHLENDGGVAWILGMKTEGGGPLLDLKNGSKTELIGSFSYTVGDSKRAPMFVIQDSEAALSFAEVCYTGAPIPIIVRETQSGTTKEIRQEDPRWQGFFSLYLTKRGGQRK